MVSEAVMWIRPTILLCANGFFRSLNPSEPYLTPYLMGPKKNLTATELVNEVYPVWIYSYLCFLFPVFLLTDFLKYKPVIVVEGLSYVGCWLLLLFGQGVLTMQVMQVFFGLATAAEIGFYSYIYSVVPDSRYQLVTSYIRAVVLLGLFLGAAVAQILVSLFAVDYFYLNVIAFVNISIGFSLSLFLPMPKRTLFFYATSKSSKASIELMPKEENSSPENYSVETVKGSGKWKTIFLSLARDLKDVYSNAVLLRWSIWWALSTCGYMLVVNYIQNLWESIRSSRDNQRFVYNGAVESFATILGAAGAFAVGYIKLDWNRWGELALGSCSILKCILLFLMYLTTSLWTCYAAYVAYIFLFNFVITIAQFRLAVGLNTERFALVFGVNTFMAVGLNTLLTVIIIDKAGLGLNVNTQFIIYSVYFGILAVSFLSHGIYSLISAEIQSRNRPVTATSSESL